MRTHLVVWLDLLAVIHVHDPGIWGNFLSRALVSSADLCSTHKCFPTKYRIDCPECQAPSSIAGSLPVLGHLPQSRHPGDGFCNNEPAGRISDLIVLYFPSPVLSTVLEMPFPSVHKSTNPFPSYALYVPRPHFSQSEEHAIHPDSRHRPLRRAVLVPDWCLTSAEVVRRITLSIS